MPKKPEMPPELREWFRQQGKAGAAKSHAMLTKKQRREKAIKAINTRWAKKNPLEPPASPVPAIKPKPKPKPLRSPVRIPVPTQKGEKQ